MTRATMSTVTVKEHRFEVPEDGDMKDLAVAMSWARNKAKELDINTDYDDWARISIGDESFAIVVVERVEG